MVEPRRSPSSTLAEAADRDSRIEALLVEGLERYFASDYDDAIHLWTRVLFLDRTHARARAYIGRARTALAERQRRADEILHAATEMLAGGDIDKARLLLAQSVDAAGEDERAASLRLQLDRLERARAADRTGARRAAAVVDAVPLRRRPSARHRAVASGVAIVSGLLLAALVTRPVIRNWLGLGTADEDLTAISTSTSPSPAAETAAPSRASSSDAALAQAESFYAAGRFTDALHALDGVDPEGTNGRNADRLRGRIQLMLASGRTAGAAPESSVASRP